MQLNFDRILKHKGNTEMLTIKKYLWKSNLLMSGKAHTIWFFFKAQKIIHTKQEELKDVVDCSPLWSCTFSISSQYVALIRHQPNYFSEGSQGCLKHLLL